eukprot:4979593-Lingulodinium_polyedra.AAC.1
MAWELSLEREPPFAAIAMRPQEATRMPRPLTCEPRWAEVALSRLRDLDEYMERRRRLGFGQRPFGGDAGRGHAPGPEAEAPAAEEGPQSAAAKRAARNRARQAAAKAKAAAGGPPPG